MPLVGLACSNSAAAAPLPYSQVQRQVGLVVDLAHFAELAVNLGSSKPSHFQYPPSTSLQAEYAGPCTKAAGSEARMSVVELI